MIEIDSETTLAGEAMRFRGEARAASSRTLAKIRQARAVIRDPHMDLTIKALYGELLIGSRKFLADIRKMRAEMARIERAGPSSVSSKYFH